MTSLDKSKLDVHRTIEKFSRVLHDGVTSCQTEIDVYTMAQIIFHLVTMLDTMIDGIEVVVVEEVPHEELS